ncbi:hypothetical protein CRENBAI_006020 [Crenichthys baileyi]|uniref:Uncharacterized protein n=1 Tax=Crenichthys baileyi TaxID=28760 RepID=A0AAV9SER8_9TELE
MGTKAVRDLAVDGNMMAATPKCSKREGREEIIKAFPAGACPGLAWMTRDGSGTLGMVIPVPSRQDSNQTCWTVGKAERHGGNKQDKNTKEKGDNLFPLTYMSKDWEPCGSGSPQRPETELPSSPGCSQDQRDKGRGRKELMKGRDSSGSLRTSRHLPSKLPLSNLLRLANYQHGISPES